MINYKIKKIYTDAGVDTRMISLIRYPTGKERNQLRTLFRRHSGRILGFCSYKDYPKRCKEDYPEVWNKVNGWCHCFRDPENYLPPNVPRILLSRSDFVHVAQKKVQNNTKKYDLIYSCLSRSQMSAKNFKLFVQCLNVVCSKMNLKVLLIGNNHVLNKAPRMRNLVLKKNMNRDKYLQEVSKSKCLFVPNIMDASPRVITEAFNCDIPVLVNQDILGGWKYINKNTGAFFKDETDIEDNLSRILSREYSTRDWFFRHYGPINSGKKLLEFVNKNFRHHVPAGYLVINDDSLGGSGPAWSAKKYTRTRQISPKLSGKVNTRKLDNSLKKAIQEPEPAKPKPVETVYRKNKKTPSKRNNKRPTLNKTSQRPPKKMAKRIHRLPKL